MPPETPKEKALRRLRHAEALETARELLPRSKKVFQDFDKSLRKLTPAARGDKSKRNGAQLFEDAAVGAVRVLKSHYAADGLPTFEAWEKAREDIADIVKVSPATLEDWQRGASKRRRKKKKA